jgi:transcriptional regulator with XRE-family HTH domain
VIFVPTGRRLPFSMDLHSRFGEQPLIEIMRRRRWTFSLLCGEVGVTYRHLYYVAHGHIVPSPKLRDKLPAVLSAPLSELFTEDALAAQYTQRKNSGAAA